MDKHVKFVMFMYARGDKSPIWLYFYT